MNNLTLDQVVERINGIFGRSAEDQAAEYAREAAENSALGITKENVECHLDVLFENGAEFDYSEALNIALN